MKTTMVLALLLAVTPAFAQYGGWARTVARCTQCTIPRGRAEAATAIMRTSTTLELQNIRLLEDGNMPFKKCATVIPSPQLVVAALL
jgi:hypothetical protein